jgi:hypothetical protein
MNYRDSRCTAGVVFYLFIFLGALGVMQFLEVDLISLPYFFLYLGDVGGMQKAQTD